tara:strand:- start:740 stop:1165 length:426 start_codon:yes stop_codon:yes gene_type:complete
MPASKKPTTTKSRAKKPTEAVGTTKNDTTDNPEEVTRTEVEIQKDVPMRYYIQFWKEVIPHDVWCGTVYWSDVRDDIIIEQLEGPYSSDIEGLLEGNLLLKDGTFVSRYETPKEWIKNAPNAILGFKFYAKEFLECPDETE